MILSHTIDCETGLPYSKSTDSNQYKIITKEVTYLSRPVFKVGLHLSIYRSYLNIVLAPNMCLFQSKNANIDAENC